MICCPVLFILLKGRGTSYLARGISCLVGGICICCPLTLYIPRIFHIPLSPTINFTNFMSICVFPAFISESLKYHCNYLLALSAHSPCQALNIINVYCPSSTSPFTTNPSVLLSLFKNQTGSSIFTHRTWWPLLLLHTIHGTATATSASVAHILFQAS